jgi:hypothetical protein
MKGHRKMGMEEKARETGDRVGGRKEDGGMEEGQKENGGMEERL